MNKISNEVFYEHFSNLNADLVDEDNDFIDITIDPIAEINEMRNLPFIELEVGKAIKSLNEYLNMHPPVC